ncbi:hypothetical protein [Pseudoduganella aquatica]|uniref:Uncharacterized protein n=1 Tax=Pseudoduganella aquatica TaxID=2660641 RepID=A0A7X4KQD0_9BURK|nr:hypothetical protein [Pseudoduganella aquatica]MYN11233.1 hypothetical protein [Pseudoduganella aquatica]
MDDTEFQIYLPPGFPLDDLFDISEQLGKADICVPGYIPPEVGLYDIRGHFYESRKNGVQTILLPDRNMASRFAQLAEGKVIPNEEQRRASAALLAFAQCLDIQMEPGIAFHELAHKQGNDVSLTELGWFRAADRSRPQDVIDVAVGREDALSSRYHPLEVKNVDLAAPLRRWNRNYVMCLKMLELEQRIDKPLNRVLSLLEWMRDEFMFGGSVALLASVYFAPRSSPKEGVFKGKNSPHRDRALDGARNQAWDLTHLSEFVRQASENEYTKKRYLFATFDQHLKLMAKLLFGFTKDAGGADAHLAALSNWWPPSDARRIIDAILAHVERIESPDWTAKKAPFPDFINRMIKLGEQRILDIAPR